MIERIVENWLIKASEKSFQLPFAYSLLHKGHEVIHISRHCAMELGKDILSLNEHGIPCAYQLKGKAKLKLSDWREINKQIIDLINLPIEHPSINSTEWHKSYLVVNGELEEEVSEAINKFNRGQESTYGNSTRNLNVISYGQMYKDAIELGANLWPTELADTKLILEIILEDEKDIFPVIKFNKLLNRHFKTNKENPSIPALQRLISSSALLTSIAINEYTKVNNYFSEILCWSTYIIKVLEIAETYKLKDKQFSMELNIAEKIVQNSLHNLYEETINSSSMLEGNLFSDVFIINSRRTIVLGLMSLHLINTQSYENKEFIQFIEKNLELIEINGESYFSFLIPLYIYSMKANENEKGIRILKMTLDKIISSNKNDSKFKFPNPYYSIEDCLLYKTLHPKHFIKEDFKSNSYIIKTVIHLLTISNERKYLESKWKEITKISQTTYEPETYTEYFKIRSIKGRTNTQSIKFPTNWSELKSQADQIFEHSIPDKLRENTLFLYLLIIILPQRINENLVKYLCTKE